MSRIGTYGQLYRIWFLESVAYRSAMMLSILTGPLFLAIQYFIWKAVFSLQPTVAGYEFTDIFRYFALVLLVGYLMYDRSHELIETRVIKGEMHITLLKPVSLMGELFTNTLANRSFAFIAEFVPISILFGFLLGWELLLPANILILLIGYAIAITIRFLINYLIGLVAFWTHWIHGLRMTAWFLYMFLTGMFFPLDLVPGWAQNIFSFTPYQHMVYSLVQYWEGSYALGPITGIMQNLLVGITWVVALYVAAKLVERAALKRYHGVGQ